jgi:hypothetical protein
MALLVDDSDALGVRKKDPDHGGVTFNMGSKIVERVRMSPRDNGIGFRRERSHSLARSDRDSMRQVPASGTRSQSGRCASSYSIS